MNAARHRRAHPALLVGLALLTAAAGRRDPRQSSPAASEPPSSAALIARGRYLVHDVAQCIQCHSPRNERGELIEGQLLTGAPIPLKSPFPGQQWAFRAPAIKGLNFLSEPEALRLLCDGIARTGRPPDPPMPRFHMTREDALAVVAYLKSLR